MDPQITNLVPVLKSYWLTIHVSIISGSYGFLALGALLGFITMLLFILRSDKRPNIDHSITELTKITEMSIIIGLVMITIGNMLGAVWANESWGRYWSWDAKETWTLVSIMVYAFIVHTRFIPKLKTAYFNAVASTVAFATIIMTYFGVNYYLSGMHSYAAGDPIPVPDFVYYTIITVVGVAVLAARKRDSILPLKK
jgi:ABC-type transport system involved in cytochrome c biogenesis permease subunit